MKAAMKNLVGLVALGFVLSLAHECLAQDPHRVDSLIKNDSSTFFLKIDPQTKPTTGKTFRAIIHVVPGHHWHIYSAKLSRESGIDPLSVSLPSSLLPYFEITNVEESGKPIVKYDSNFQTVTKYQSRPFDVAVSIKAKKNSKDPIPFSLFVRYTTCNEGSQCMPPRSFAVPMVALHQKPLQLTIAYGTPDTTSKSIGSLLDTSSKGGFGHDSTGRIGQTAGGASSEPPMSGPPAKAVIVDKGIVGVAEESIWKFILAAAGFGLLALLTPCVFPMVPITVSFFTKRNAGSKKEATKDALLYAGGIIVTFVALGFLLSLAAGPAGINEFAANPFANLIIAAIFVAFALNLFGLFEIGVPSSILSKLNTTAQKSKNRAFSVVLMGFVFSLTSFTCTVPFVGTLMVAFSRGSWFVPLIGMVVFASIFALPFFLLALFPNLMKSLPRSGTWMNNVKVVMGFLEIAAALKFFSNVDLIWSWHFFSRDMVLATWMAIAIIVTLYLLGRFQLSHDTPLESIGAIRVLIAVVFLSMGIYLYTGLNGRPMGQLDAFLPPNDTEGQLQMATMMPTGSAGGQGMQNGQSPQGAAQQMQAPVAAQWFPSYPAALAEAKKTGKNIFIDFTGYTCTNCRAMEATVFSRQDVKQMFGNFVLARLYTDNGTPLNDSNRTLEEARFNTIALPFYVIVSPDDKPLGTFPGFTRDAESFKTFLREQSSRPSPAVAMLGK